jgi:hypothetical protein
MTVRFTSWTVRATRRANPVGALLQSVIAPLFGRRPFATQDAVPPAGTASHHPENVLTLRLSCTPRPNPHGTRASNTHT